MKYEDGSKLLDYKPENYESIVASFQKRKGFTELTTEVSSKKTFSHLIHWGLSMALLSAFLGSIKGWMVSCLDNLSPIQICGLRAVGTITFIVPVVLYQKYPLWFDFRTNCYLFFRSLLGNISVIGYYYGCSYLHLADASLIYYTTPVYTMLIGCLFLKERCGFIEMFSLGCTLCGVCLVTLPSLSQSQTSAASTQSFKGVFGCLTGAFAQSIVLAILRKLQHVPPVVTCFWWAVTGAASLVFMTSFGEFRVWSCGWDGCLVVMLALCGFTCEISMVLATSVEEAGKVSVVLSSEILWAFLLQVVLQKTPPQISSIAGGLCILVAVFSHQLYDLLRKPEFCAKMKKLFIRHS